MLEVRSVSKHYGRGSGRVDALRGVSMAVDDGEFVAIAGPSGSGKSTLLNIIGGLDRATSGEVLLDGMRIDGLSEDRLVDIRRSRISYVFQQYHLIPSLTALENVMLPLTFRGIRTGDDRNALEALARVGLDNRAKHKPGQLSGGEQQRVAIARALVNGGSLILADEPTGNLDRRTGLEILELFQQVHRDGHAIVMITHSPDVAKRASRLLVLQDGQMATEI